jgi:undecaprenyl-diphosphatase
MIQVLKDIDYACFLWLQNHLRGMGADQFFIVMRNPIYLKWGYVGLAVLLLLKFRQKAIPAMAFLGMAMGAADLTSSRLFKPFFHRLRPCQDSHWNNYSFHPLVDCGAGFSFTSSHAATNMAAAVFLSLLLSKYWGKSANLILLWGFVIGFSQIIVGVHYPIDVLGGFIIGAFWAMVLHLLYKKLPSKFSLEA